MSWVKHYTATGYSLVPVILTHDYSNRCLSGGLKVSGHQFVTRPRIGVGDDVGRTRAGPLHIVCHHAEHALDVAFFESRVGLIYRLEILLLLHVIRRPTTLPSPWIR
jgi:hypothetical protein